jgi:hypothetical protein
MEQTKPPCLFFAKGRCHSGVECRFSHQFDVQVLANQLRQLSLNYKPVFERQTNGYPRVLCIDILNYGRDLVDKKDHANVIFIKQNVEKFCRLAKSKGL